MKNIVNHSHKVSRADREKIKKQKGCVLWFTGLSGSGKSTIANELEYRLNSMKLHTYLLDGDNLRRGLNKDLGFSDNERSENIRRLSEVAKLFLDAGLIVMVASISPFKKDREQARRIVGNEFIEVFVDTPLATCIQRDPKGLYQKALNREISNYTGLDSPYEKPLNPDISIETQKTSVEESTEILINLLRNRKVIDE